MDIFFVLSGFLIGTQVLKPLQRGEAMSLARFYARRAWRIVPAFAVVLTLYACFPGLREAPGLQPWWQFATFTVNLLIDYERNQAFSHAWSLCVEEHFHLVFPVLAWALARRLSAYAGIGLWAAVVALGMVLRASVWLHDAGLHTQRNWFIEDIYYPTWMRMDGLLVGVMLAALRVYRPQQWSRWQERSQLCLVAGLAACGLAFWLFRDRTGLLANTLGWPLLSSGFGLLVIAGASRRSLIGRRPLAGAAWIATISYSLYLSHKIAFHLVSERLVPWLPHSGVLLFATYALAALSGGAALHYLVERPFLQWRDRRAAA
ncbi:MAG TPA: acyltransferase, partial [Albitalea sp.]|nr:acyltransferase [Albitalea sp.]